MYCLCPNSLNTLGTSLSLSSSLMCRTAEEVPWHLQRADLKKELYHTIISVDILVQLYAGLAITYCV